MIKIISNRILYSSLSNRLYSYSIQNGLIYDRYINEHIRKSLQSVSSPNKLKCKSTCQKYFVLVSNNLVKSTSSNDQPSKQRKQQGLEEQQKIKSLINMIFSGSFQLQNFDRQRQIVCEMIYNRQINSQSLLDRVIKFIFKQIKWNSNIDYKQIKGFLQNLSLKQKQFKTQIDIDSLNNNKQFSPKNINQFSKKYRDSYPQVDSKLIFDTINSIINKNKQNIQLSNQSTNSNLKTQTTKSPSASKIKSSNAQSNFIEQNKFWDKIHKIKPRLIKQQLNTPQIFQQHKLITQNKLRFRFPPQPNGYLHIGHIKSIRMNFQTAKRLNGECFLRYDDTNPQKQTPQFIEQIQKNVKWMGYTPDKINFTSDYFQQMMQFANKLVKQGNAYVCQSSQQQIQLQRKQKRQNPFRLKPIQFSLKAFPHLSPYQTLRLKLDPTSPNPTLRDPIIYRYKNHPHPKTGTKFTIYPMYDFAHCISDSLQHIDYSLCSLQFQIRRQLYYKILDMLGLYKPIVWQFSRLNVKGNVISKRKIKQLIDDNKIQGWDDPRLLTIKGMQRRGYTPKMVNQFIDKVNSSRNGNQKYVRFQVLQKQMKKQLSKNCKKIIALKNPIKINLLKTQIRQKLCEEQQEMLNQSEIYIEKQEIQKVEDGKEIILKQRGVFRVKRKGDSIQMQASIKSVQQIKKENEKVPILGWLLSDKREVKVIIYQSLLDENEQFNSNSRKQERLYLNKQAEQQLKEAEQNKVFLFERIGYFRRDQKTKQLICCTQV